jgi:hypothetical protein
MSTYRSAPAPRKPIVVVMKRTLFSILITVFLFGFLSIFVVVLCSRVTVACSRSEATCRVLVERGPGIVTKDETYPISSVERASVEKHVDDEGDELEGIALVINGKAALLDGSSNVWHDEKVKWAETVNAFLQDPSSKNLEIKRGALWPAYGWTLFVLWIVVVVLRARTRFTIDKEEGILEVDERSLGRTVQTFPLSEVASAEIHEKPGDEVMVRAIRLRLVDGTTKELTGYSNVGDADKIRVVAEINAALATDA